MPTSNHQSSRYARAIRSACCCAIVAALMPLAACNARKDFPDPEVGWHSPSFDSVFGILQKVPGATPADPPTWVVRFGTPQDPYGGILALTPPNRLVGYTGGERIEIKGHPMTQATTDGFNGRWYVVDSIQLWSTYR